MPIPLAFISGGAAAGFAATISTNQTNLNLRSWALSNGWDGTAAATITISSGTIISGTSDGHSSSYALLIDGSWPAGVILINQGNIVGRGGAGGNGGGFQAETPGNNGGTALRCTVSVSINNTGTIAGGGGGGGGGSGETFRVGDEGYLTYGGGGGGGGRSNTAASAPGGAGGTGDGGNGTSGGSGTYSSAGGGGGGAYGGGNGGNWGQDGSASQCCAGYGGQGGRSVNGNSYITWIATGTRLGPIV